MAFATTDESVSLHVCPRLAPFSSHSSHGLTDFTAVGRSVRKDDLTVHAQPDSRKGATPLSERQKALAAAAYLHSSRRGASRCEGDVCGGQAMQGAMHEDVIRGDARGCHKGRCTRMS